MNVVAYLVVWVLVVARTVFFTRDFFRDTIDHQRGPGYFTSVAASCILGSQFILIVPALRAAAR